MKTTMAAVSGKAKSYAFSAVGIVHACALVSSFITFACNESASWCSGYSYCAVPIYKSTYMYFSVTALTALLMSGCFYVLHLTGLYEKLKCSSKRKLLMELSCVSATVFFFAVGNFLMISRTGYRTIYMVSTFIGFTALSMFSVQLALIFRRNYSRLIAEGREDESAADVDSDDSCPDGEPSVQVKVIKSWNMGDRSPGNQSQKDNSSSNNLKLENSSIGHLSINSSLSSRNVNPSSMVVNEDYCTSSSSEDGQPELKNKLALSD